MCFCAAVAALFGVLGCAEEPESHEPDAAVADAGMDAGTDAAPAVPDAGTAVSVPPNALDDARTVNEDSTDNALNVLANDSDPDDGALTIVEVSTPDSGGVATTDGASVSYTPASGFLGVETFSYTVDDGDGNTDTATVTVTVVDPTVTMTFVADNLPLPIDELGAMVEATIPSRGLADFSRWK